jgi:glycerophosphoryl diester phosphodiesterase
MTEKRKRLRRTAVSAAVAGTVYLYTIMPRLLHKPDKQAFETHFFAHRGLHRNGTAMPENSLPAIRKAAEEGYGIEFDIQVTKDGVPVVFHDFTLHRMCGQRGRVCDYTLEELRKFHLLDCGEKIPTFAEALAAVDGRVPLIIEMKVEYADLRVCRAADRLLRDYHGVYCLESFNPLVLLWYRKNRPDVMRGQLSDGFVFQREFRTPVKLAPGLIIQFLCTNFVTRPDFIAYNHKYQSNLSRRLWHRLFRGKAAAWTVKSEEDLKRAKKHFDVFIFDSFIPHGGHSVPRAGGQHTR